MYERLTKRKGLIFLATAIAVFLLLTVPRLGASSLWFDESFTAYLMRYDVNDIIAYTGKDVHPPLYYLVLKGWSSIFGMSAVALRSLSIVFGVVALILVYFLIKKLFSDQKVAGVAALAVAAGPLFIRYGVEARMYMMVIAVGLAGALIYLKAEQSKGYEWWFAYGLVMAVGMWTHYFAVFWWLGFWVYRYFTLKNGALRGKELLHKFFTPQFIWAHILATACYLPWLPVAYAQTGQLSGGYWIPTVTIDSVGDSVADILLYRPKGTADNWYAVLEIVAIAIIATFWARAVRNTRGTRAGRGMIFLTALALAPIILLFLVSLYPLKSFYILRYVLPSVTLTYAVLGILIASSPSFANWPLVVVTLICLISGDRHVWALGNYNFNTSDASPYTMTGEVVRLTDKRYPVLASGDYNYYEAAAYETAQQKVYYDYSLVKDSPVGSMAMLKDNKLGRGIKDMKQFGRDNQYVWVVGSDDEPREEGNDTPIEPPKAAKDFNWKVVKTVGAPEPGTGDHIYRATLYRTR